MTGVAAGIFHHLHQSLIDEFQRALNSGLLPNNFYALAEQRAAGYGPDLLTPQVDQFDDQPAAPLAEGHSGLIVAKPQEAMTAESAMEFYRRKQNVATVRHVSDDRVIALVEVVSPGNKSSRSALRSFVE